MATRRKPSTSHKQCHTTTGCRTPVRDVCAEAPHRLGPRLVLTPSIASGHRGWLNGWEMFRNHTRCSRGCSSARLRFVGFHGPKGLHTSQLTHQTLESAGSAVNPCNTILVDDCKDCSPSLRIVLCPDPASGHHWPRTVQTQSAAAAD